MKNTTTKKASAKKKLLPAAGSLLISAAMLSTSTYAWFTMNKTVTVSGMEMKTTVGANLLISDNNYESDYTTEALSQGRKALLEPVSSISGANGTFYYTTNALGNGDAVEDEYAQYDETETSLTNGAIDLIQKSTQAGEHPSTSGAGKSGYDSDFNSDYAATPAANAANAYTNAYGYVDYVFYLKGTGDATDQYIKMTKCNLLYDNKAITTPAVGSGTAVVGDNVDRAWRAAVFCSEVSAANAGKGEQTTNAIADNLKAILTLESAENHSGAKAIAGKSAVPANLAQAYNTWSDATNGSIATVANKTTGYYMVTVRVWLEGEDTTCTSKTYAQLDNTWKLDCEFQLKNSATAVDKIGSVVSGS